MSQVGDQLCDAICSPQLYGESRTKPVSSRDHILTHLPSVYPLLPSCFSCSHSPQSYPSGNHLCKDLHLTPYLYGTWPKTLSDTIWYLFWNISTKSIITNINISISGLTIDQEEYYMFNFLKLISNSNMNMLKILQYVVVIQHQKKNLLNIKKYKGYKTVNQFWMTILSFLSIIKCIINITIKCLETV